MHLKIRNIARIARVLAAAGLARFHLLQHQPCQSDAQRLRAGELFGDQDLPCCARTVHIDTPASRRCLQHAAHIQPPITCQLERADTYVGGMQKIRQRLAVAAGSARIALASQREPIVQHEALDGAFDAQAAMIGQCGRVAIGTNTAAIQ